MNIYKKKKKTGKNGVRASEKIHLSQTDQKSGRERVEMGEKNIRFDEDDG